MRTHKGRSRPPGATTARLLGGLKIVALVLAVGLIPLMTGVVLVERQSRQQASNRLDGSLANVADAEAAALEAYFARARSIILVTAQNPSFRSVYRSSGTDSERAEAVDEVNGALAYLERLYPSSVGEACVIDAAGPEVARVTRGVRAAAVELSPDESTTPFFAPAFRLRVGEVLQSAPYVSPDTGEWVISNATRVPGLAEGSRAIVHFEVSVESFRQAAVRVGGGRFDITVADARTGQVVYNARDPQQVGARLGRPGDRRFFSVAQQERAAGALDLGGSRAVYRRLASGPSNENDWVVVATAAPVAGKGIGALTNLPVFGLLLLLIVVGLLVARRWLRRGDEAASDPLTGLPNRRLFNDRIDHALATARREGYALTVMLIDLDHFKEVNDVLGHQFGDLLLQEVSTRVREAARESDTVARLGGDEFAVLLPRMRDREASLEVAEKLLQAIARPITLKEGTTLEVDASVGIALFPEHGLTADELLRHADVAMYVAKAARSGKEVYSPDQDHGSAERLSLVAELRGAIEHEQLVVYYQPKVDLGCGETMGVEALVRWQHPTRGLLGPDHFIPVAERSSLIRPLTLYVLERALADCRRWEEAGVILSVSVNLSAHHLMDTGLPAQVAELLSSSGLDPARLELELTETALMADPVRSLAVLRRLSEMGVMLSIDDFGVGYSSLNYLKKLPVDVLKIDRSFVMNMELSPEDAMIVRSTIDLARNLGLRTVAEGVESADSMDRLRALGCDLAQGFHLSRAIPADELLRWAQARRATASSPAP
jgi:diguanylate cyclase (GGDEF)-like protein